MKRFYLRRVSDVSGVSGIGNVVEGCLFDNGKAAFTWLSDKPITSVADSIAQIIDVHGHEGCTELIWIDEDSSNVTVERHQVIQSEQFRQLTQHL